MKTKLFAKTIFVAGFVSATASHAEPLGFSKLNPLENVSALEVNDEDKSTALESLLFLGVSMKRNGFDKGLKRNPEWPLPVHSIERLRRAFVSHWDRAAGEQLEERAELNRFVRDTVDCTYGGRVEVQGTTQGHILPMDANREFSYFATTTSRAVATNCREGRSRTKGGRINGDLTIDLILWGRSTSPIVSQWDADADQATRVDFLELTANINGLQTLDFYRATEKKHDKVQIEYKNFQLGGQFTTNEGPAYRAVVLEDPLQLQNLNFRDEDEITRLMTEFYQERMRCSGEAIIDGNAVACGALVNFLLERAIGKLEDN